MKIAQLVDFLESIAPSSLQESYDNAGLITGQHSWECTGVLTTLDCIEEVVDEAISKKCNLIVAHHPIVFSGLKKINGKNYVERTIIKAIKNDIAIYAIHTNLDNVLNGVNGVIADKLNLSNRSVLLPRQVEPEFVVKGISELGAGLVGELPEAVDEQVFLRDLKAIFGVPSIRHTTLLGRKIKKVAVCGGAGSFMIFNALEAKVDIFITADMKYHQFFDADGKMVLADIGHFETEQFTTEFLQAEIAKKFPNFAVLKTAVNTNPVCYF
jgi:dinuclear metal center YbgI/SA1388 family protein